MDAPACDSMPWEVLMKRILLVTFGAVLSTVTSTNIQADDWRPAQERSVSLGKPQKASALAASDSRPDDSVVPAGLSPLSGLNLQPTGLVVRGQSPDRGVQPAHGGPHPPAAIPGSPEEQYNCGVVSEGPPSGGLFSGGGHPWWGGLGGFGNIFGFYTNFLSDHAFDSFISPVSNPFFFEDPRSLTELRPIFIYQRSPGGNAAFSKANTEMIAIQARLALTDRWSLTLNKLGFLAVQSDGTFGDHSGLSELDFGIKYTFWRDDAANTIMALGLQAELPIGSSGIAQDTGSASLTPYISAAQQLWQNWHVMGTFGYRFAIDDERSESFFLSAHIDYSIYNRIYPLLEVTWWHVVQNGKNLPGGFEGQDLFNFGNANAKGDVVTLAAGVRFKITEAAQAGVVFELPLTGSKDIMDWRITADVILRY
jgi:hypothetical protein